MKADISTLHKPDILTLQRHIISFGLDLRVNACRILGNGSLTIRAVWQPSPAGEKFASRSSASCCP